ncbi:MAG: PfkB family carbohydrate kinase, partial [Candidatus Bathyarchaeota archaeon]
MKPLWPYIVPLPIERKELNRVFQAVFGSKAALEILKKSSPGKRVYQKELILELNFLNKTIIEALKKLVSANILEQGMERHKEKGKTVWTKWYTPTFQGKWLALLLQPTANIPIDEAKKITTELFSLYIENTIKLCANYGIEPEIFKSIMNNAFLKAIEETKPKTPQKSQVMVYGSVAMDTITEVDRVPIPEETIYLSDVYDYPGGSAANVAVALRRLGILVSFVG